MTELVFPRPAFAKKDPSEVVFKPSKIINQKILARLWSKGLKSASKKKYYPEGASPIIHEDRVYVGTHSGLFYAFNLRDGTAAWIFESSGPIASQAGVFGDAVFFGNNKGSVYALSAASGEKIWEAFVDGEILSQPVSDGRNLYFVTTGREVVSLSNKTGEKNWSMPVRGYDRLVTMRGLASLTLAGDKIYAGFSDGQVSALASNSGTILWDKSFDYGNSPFTDVDARILSEGNIIYVAGYYGQVSALSASSGELLWQSELKSGTDLIADSSSLFLSTTDGKTVALDKKTGFKKWETPIASGALSPPALLGSYLLVGGGENSLYVLDSETGRALQRISISGGVYGVIDTNQEFASVLSGSGNLSLFRVQK